MKKLSMKPIIYTILILIAITTFTCIESKSKYIKEDGSAIKYSVYIKKMSGTPLNSLPHGKLASSTYEDMKFFYSFNRSGNMLTTDTSETYEIIPKSTCAITSITAANAIIYGNLVTFNSIGNETITVYLNCNVEANTVGDYINVSLNVNNYFNNSLPKFLYTNGINNVSVSDYNLAHPKPEITDFYSDDYKTYIMKTTRDNKLEGLTTWLSLLANEYPVITYDNIYNYIDFISNETDITDSNISLLNNYEGLTSEIDSEGNYVFNVDDRFISIVKSHSEKISKKLYFYEGNYNIDELFLFYIDYFGIYTEGSLEYTTISDYMTINEADDETILDLANRLKLGMTYNNETKMLDGVEYLYNHIIYDIPIFEYDKTKAPGRKLATFTNKLNNVTILTGSDLLSQISSQTNNDRLIELLSITDPSTMFDGYVYYESSVDGIDALVHVYSNDTTYVYMEVIIVDSNILTYEYSNVDITSIKSDLEYISTTFYDEDLSLLDVDPEVVNNYKTLENGTYNLNIGTITITGDRIVIITLGDRDVTQNNSIEESLELEEINNNEEISIQEGQNE